MRSDLRLRPLRNAARTVCGLLLLLAATGPACADEAKPLTAILLEARSKLPDPYFKDSVVLVMNNLGPAPAGVIVNRPTKLPVSHLFPDLQRLAQDRTIAAGGRDAFYKGDLAKKIVDFSQSHGGQQLLGAVLYLMCDDLDALMASLKAKKVQCSDVEKAPWGSVTTIPLPSGGRIGLYQPRHPTALNLKSK